VSAAEAVEEELDASESRCTAEMTPARRHEFASGRSAARCALAGAGHSCPVVAISHEGFPVFPEGYVGSIAHKHGRAIAVVAQSVAGGIGIDLEFDDPGAEADLRQTVITKLEGPALQDIATAQPDLGSPSTLVLSAKEAVYKAVFPMRRKLFDFQDLYLDFEIASNVFRAVRFPGRRGLQVAGRYAINSKWIVCIAIAEPVSV
jgi:4'-phosphopantetheinyl transferase EntD